MGPPRPDLTGETIWFYGRCSVISSSSCRGKRGHGHASHGSPVSAHDRAEQEIAKRSAAASGLYGSLDPAQPSVDPAMVSAQRAVSGNSAVNSRNRSEIHVGQITVPPDTTDSAKVGQDLRHDLSQHGLIAGAAFGMTRRSHSLAATSPPPG